MSRLYLKANTDTRRTELHSRAHEKVEIEVFYGSKKDSRSLVKVLVEWPRIADRPTVFLVSEGQAGVYLGRVPG